ncbi:MAG: hypothetical protein RL033_5735 [Pseudomonadota bacterium]
MTTASGDSRESTALDALAFWAAVCFPCSSRHLRVTIETMGWRWRGLAGLAACVLCTASARAEVPGSAVELFERGVAAMQEGKLDSGCPALDESYRLEAQPGALFAAAHCHAAWGKLHGAVKRYEAYVALFPGLLPEQQVRHVDRLKLARRELERLTPIVPRLELVVPAPVPARLAITLDEKAFPLTLLGQLVPLDPGPHSIETVSDRGVGVRTTFDIAVGEHRRIVLSEAAPPASIPLPPPQVAPADARSATGPAERATAARRKEAVAMDQPASRMTTAVGWVLAGVGVAGLTVGTAAGIAVLSQKGINDEECDPTGCSRRGKRAADRGEASALVADVGFGVGVVGLVAGAVILLGTTSSPSPAATAALRTKTEHWQPFASVGSGGLWLGAHQRW